jgi:hypothetical protein
MFRHYNNTRSITSYFYLVIYMYCYLLKGKFQTKKCKGCWNRHHQALEYIDIFEIHNSSNKLYLNLYVSNFPKFSWGGHAPLACPVMVIFSLRVGVLTFCLGYYFFFPVKVKLNPCFVILLHIRYDNVTLSPLLLPARVTNRSHSTYGSSARSDSHRVVFCPTSVGKTRQVHVKLQHVNKMSDRKKISCIQIFRWI